MTTQAFTLIYRHPEFFLTIAQVSVDSLWACVGDCSSGCARYVAQASLATARGISKGGFGFLRQANSSGLRCNSLGIRRLELDPKTPVIGEPNLFSDLRSGLLGRDSFVHADSEWPRGVECLRPLVAAFLLSELPGLLFCDEPVAALVADVAKNLKVAELGLVPVFPVEPVVALEIASGAAAFTLPGCPLLIGAETNPEVALKEFPV